MKILYLIIFLQLKFICNLKAISKQFHGHLQITQWQQVLTPWRILSQLKSNMAMLCLFVLALIILSYFSLVCVCVCCCCLALPLWLFVLKYFILFDAISYRIVFLITFLCGLILVSRNTTYFCILIFFTLQLWQVFFFSSKMYVCVFFRDF